MNEPVFTTDAMTGKIKNVLGNGRGTLLLSIIGVALSTASAFMFCLASIGFDFTQLSEPTFWSRWASMFISMLSAYAFVLLHKDERNRLSEWYVKKVSTLMELSISIGLNFDSYLEDYNLERRKAWYKNNINAKIAKLSGKLVVYRLKGKPTDEIEKQINIFKEYADDAYIEKNKLTLKTRSKPIRSSQVLTESQRGHGGEENLRSVGTYYGIKVLSKVAFSLISSAAFASVVVQNFNSGLNVASITMMIFTLLSIVLSIVTAILAANGCYKSVYVPNVLFKIKILSGYHDWKEKKKAQPQNTKVEQYDNKEEK